MLNEAMNPEQEYKYQQDYENNVKKAADYLKRKLRAKPEFGIVFGSGLNKLERTIDWYEKIDYASIPNFPATTVDGHKGSVILGNIEDVPVVGLSGRIHYYEVGNEPYGMLKVIFPVHVLAELGVKNYFATNSAGGLNPSYKERDLMLINSHYSFIPNPLIGRHMKFTRVDNCNRVERFQAMNETYNKEFRRLFLEASKGVPVKVHIGMYTAATGPSYETEMQSVFYRDVLKGQAVGMSTAPEIEVAVNRGMKCIGVSSITNVIRADGTNAADDDEVKSNSKIVSGELSQIIRNFFRLYRERFMQNRGQ